MAVVRIKANRHWFRKVAALTEDYPRLARELLRAVDRPGSTAELGADEIRVLAERCPLDEKVNAAFVAILASEERERVGHQRIQNMLNARRGMEL